MSAEAALQRLYGADFERALSCSAIKTLVQFWRKVGGKNSDDWPLHRYTNLPANVEIGLICVAQELQSLGCHALVRDIRRQVLDNVKYRQLDLFGQPDKANMP
ncbi:hypothetical protein L1F30_11880 [Simiduia sp. 21SJ11W-1]|uniref:hypothetical protein n=1 Tax=Simiduia sp. 21SJ11W-1 TaxID=2909669 RepID=UPI00209CC5BA|nr:hypothetical protein [Simiduia sp. 21SJ11W-1]UTA46860.1 hypothetical protein L1F30_11880 [Simiduia sp. 21SJ11W-1]